MLSSMLVAALLAAAPQVNATATTAAAAAAGTVTVQIGAQTRTVRPTTRVCVRTERTGSLIAFKTCRSYARWLADGIDPMQARRVR